MTSISCIIINYNTASFTIDCIKSIWENNTQKNLFEIIVVDNASEKEDLAQLKNFKDNCELEFILVESRVNLGFGGGNMLGVQHAQNPDYYAFINNDTLLFEENTLEVLKNFMDRHNHIGVCSPQMLDQDRNFRPTIDHFCTLKREFLKRASLEKFNPEKYPDRKRFYDQPIKANYVQGSFMFIRAEDFNAVGGFDPNIFLYYEESDLCMRILNRRKKDTYLFPKSNYIHYRGTSIRKNPSITIKTELKLSLLYVIRKHQGWFSYKVLLNFLRIRYLLTSLVKPSYFQLTKVLFRGAHITDSLKSKQIIKQ